MLKDGYELEHSQDTRKNCEQNKNVLFRLTTIGTGVRVKFRVHEPRA